MIVLDTTVLIYAVGEPHQFRDPCRTLVDAIAEGVVEATTTAEVIQEFAYVRARRRGRADASDNALDALRIFSPLLVTTEQDIRDGLTLWRRHENLGSFDAILAATAARSGALALVSADRGFAPVRGVRHLTPTQEAVDTLIASGAH